MFIDHEICYLKKKLNEDKAWYGHIQSWWKLTEWYIYLLMKIIVWQVISYLDDRFAIFFWKNHKNSFCFQFHKIWIVQIGNGKTMHRVLRHQIIRWWPWSIEEALCLHNPIFQFTVRFTFTSTETPVFQYSCISYLFFLDCFYFLLKKIFFHQVTFEVMVAGQK